ncbi:hypothetical protein A2335_01130 [Candidatus Peregrinibacteria bacterium RIFOXYB2_FULL_32_7]|nr:MAG: hypothetical protein A2335_01130 [Candidatus Peregrinibacteria bacterium RIFOXYB2_FULL_32_7]
MPTNNQIINLPQNQDDHLPASADDFALTESSERTQPIDQQRAETRGEVGSLKTGLAIGTAVVGGGIIGHTILSRQAEEARILADGVGQTMNSNGVLDFTGETTQVATEAITTTLQTNTGWEYIPHAITAGILAATIPLLTWVAPKIAEKIGFEEAGQEGTRERRIAQAIGGAIPPFGALMYHTVPENVLLSPHIATAFGALAIGSLLFNPNSQETEWAKKYLPALIASGALIGIDAASGWFAPEFIPTLFANNQFITTVGLTLLASIAVFHLQGNSRIINVVRSFVTNSIVAGTSMYAAGASIVNIGFDKTYEYLLEGLASIPTFLVTSLIIVLSLILSFVKKDSSPSHSTPHFSSSNPNEDDDDGDEAY